MRCGRALLNHSPPPHLEIPKFAYSDVCESLSLRGCGVVATLRPPGSGMTHLRTHSHQLCLPSPTAPAWILGGSSLLCGLGQWLPLSELPFLGMKWGLPATASKTQDPKPSDPGAQLWAWCGVGISPCPAVALSHPVWMVHRQLKRCRAEAGAAALDQAQGGWPAHHAGPREVDSCGQPLKPDPPASGFHLLHVPRGSSLLVGLQEDEPGALSG